MLAVLLSLTLEQILTQYLFLPMTLYILTPVQPSKPTSVTTSHVPPGLIPLNYSPNLNSLKLTFLLTFCYSLCLKQPFFFCIWQSSFIPQDLYQMPPSLWSPPRLVSPLLVLITPYPNCWFTYVIIPLDHKLPFNYFILSIYLSPKTVSWIDNRSSINVWWINEDTKIRRRYQKGNEFTYLTADRQTLHWPWHCIGLKAVCSLLAWVSTLFL